MILLNNDTNELIKIEKEREKIKKRKIEKQYIPEHKVNEILKQYKVIKGKKR